MVKKFEIDENLIAMAAFTRVIKRFYEGLGADSAFRSPEVLEAFKRAMTNPESFCKLDFDIDDIQRKYANLKITSEYDPSAIDADIVEGDIFLAYDGIDEDDYTQSIAINAGRFLDMLDDKTFGYYKIGDFAPGRDDSYFMGVFNEKMKYYMYHKSDTSKCDSDKDSNLINVSCSVVDVKEIVKQVKTELLSEIMQEIPKAFERTTYTNLKNVK